jgi:hypothetical protein
MRTSPARNGTMDKLQLTGQNVGRVFNFRSGHLHSEHLWCYPAKLPKLKLKTRPKQLLGSLPLDIALPDGTLKLSVVNRQKFNLVQPVAFLHDYVTSCVRLCHRHHKTTEGFCLHFSQGMLKGEVSLYH